MIELTLPLKGRFKLEQDGWGDISAEITVNESDVLDHFDAREIAAYFDHNELLAQIGKQAAMDYWDLSESE